MKTIIITILAASICIVAKSQINEGGKPYSFENKLNIDKIEQKTLPIVNINFINVDSLSKTSKNKYAKPVKVNLNLNNSGEWIRLCNGDRLWRLTIHCPSAKSINLIYDKFWLPTGGKLYIYDKYKSNYIGGFTNKNNKGLRENPSKFVTDLLFSDEITLEYYEPKDVEGSGIISISNVMYGFVDVSSNFPTENYSTESVIQLDDTSSVCVVDVNCSPEGDDWQVIKRSVVRMVMTNGAWCTANLVNNTENNGIPYLLTAEHCLADLDAENNPDGSDVLIWWNYEYTNCDSRDESTPLSTSGVVVTANGHIGIAIEYALLKLLETPYDQEPSMKPYFIGWDRQTQNPNDGWCIHHPKGTPKVISITDHIWDVSYAWKVRYKQTTNGFSVTYGGSSGSSLLNNQGRTVGILSRGDPEKTCEQLYDGLEYTASFVKFGLAYTGYGTDPRRKLRSWLDPNNIDPLYINGMECSSSNILYINNVIYSADEIVNACSINISNTTVNNNSSVVFNPVYEIEITDNFEAQINTELVIK